MTSRRKTLQHLAGGLVAASLPAFGHALPLLNLEEPMPPLKGNINHSICQWTYNHLSLEDLCILVKSLGFNAIDLIGPEGWPILKKYGIDCSMCYGKVFSLTDGWNNPKNHDDLVKHYSEAIELVADAGYKNLILFSGNRRGMDDKTGMENCAKGLKRILPLAEKRGVILQIELFNSKVDHPDYMADSTAWTVELAKKLGSPNFKILYDIYHMQIMEGDIIRTITDNINYIGHIHTAGVPGRNEINSSQELYFPAIMRAIVKTGYKGYVAQEFIPKGEDKIASLREAILLCDV